MTNFDYYKQIVDNLLSDSAYGGHIVDLKDDKTLTITANGYKEIILELSDSCAILLRLSYHQEEDSMERVICKICELCEVETTQEKNL